jgi:hypothetical protein
MTILDRHPQEGVSVNLKREESAGLLAPNGTGGAPAPLPVPAGAGRGAPGN